MVIASFHKEEQAMDAITNPENPIATKQSSLLTAAQIAENCPAKLSKLGKRITAHLENAAQCDDRANNHRISAAQHLLAAKEACDEGGFDAFREKCCHGLGRTRAYELLAIASGKKSVEEIRADNAERSRKHRAERRAAAVRCVTESAAPKASRPLTTALQIAKAEKQKARAEAVVRMFSPAATKGIPGAMRLGLIQALRRLASESAAERAEAAVAVERERARLNMEWDALIVPAEVAETEQRQAA
jgi:hypothetical protein